VAGESEGTEPVGDRKAPERSQIGRVLVVGTLRLKTNQGGIEQENEPDFGGCQASGE